MNLKKSPVVFVDDPHGYWLDGKRMSGITSLIRQVLNLGNYPDATDFVRNVAIPRAGEYGSAVHRAIETYDKLGLMVTDQQRSDRFGGGFWNVESELMSYIRNREGYEPIANEYTVSDNVRYASNIDNVWLKTETQGIWLVDTKTNNLAYYPGGVESLKEYLSWQLSIYAYLFEGQNPDLRVEGLACNWLRDDDSHFWVIERKSDLDVQLLLTVPWVYSDNGFVYDASVCPFSYQHVPAKQSRQEIIGREMVQQIHYMLKVAQEVKETTEVLKAKLREAMEREGIKSWDSELFRATISADTTSTAFDTSRFKADHPDLYKQYCKHATRKGGFTVKLKELVNRLTDIKK